MPLRPLKPCRHPACPNTHRNPSGYCDAHASLVDSYRPAAGARGYGAAWRRIRERVLSRAGIPPADWHRYDVDHSPVYNPTIEPDHSKYTLTPRLHADHSRKTATVDGGYGRPRVRA